MALFPSEASAQEITGGGATYLSFVFGERFGVGWGFEGFATALIVGGTDCSTAGGAGVGLTAQLGAIDADTFQFVAGAHGGGSVDNDDYSPVVDGEVGMVLQAGHGDVRTGLHLGALVDVPVAPVMAWSNFFRAEVLLNQYSVGGGLAFPGRFGLSQSTCVIGRPLRRGGAIVDPGTARVSRPCRKAARDAWRTVRREASATTLDARLEAGRAWAEDAQAEAASIPAFVALARELLALGADDALVDRALDAAEDEVRHARRCAAIASRLLGEHVVPVIPATPPREALAREDALARLAIESWLDGCLNEGAASERAAAGAAAAPGPLGTTLRRIADDEARHAQLGWEVLRFALAAGGERATAAVAAERGAHIGFSREVSPRAARYGQIERGSSERIHERVAAQARRGLEATLRSGLRLQASGF